MGYNKIPHLDAADSIFVQRQLQHLKRTQFEVQYGVLKHRELFPSDEEIPDGAEFIRYEVFDQVGMAVLISSYADDLPRADVKVKEFISPVKPVGTSFGWNIDEIAAARMANRDLNARKQKAALRATEQKFHDLALNGDAFTNIPGFLTNPNIPTITAPDPGGGSEWVNKTPDQVLTDLQTLVNTIMSNSNGIEIPDTLIMPIAQFNFISEQRIGIDSTQTTLSYFLGTNRFIKDVDWVPELSTASSANGDLAAAYWRNPEVLTEEIVKEPEMLPPQPDGLETIVPIHAKHGGVIVYRPLACQFMDGI